MKFNFPPIPDIPITLKVSGKINTQIKESGGSLKISTSGSFYAQAEADKVPTYSSISVSAKGTVLNFSNVYTLSKDGSVTRTGAISSGKISITVTAKAVSGEETTETYTLWNGWTIS